MAVRMGISSSVSGLALDMDRGRTAHDRKFLSCFGAVLRYAHRAVDDS